MGLDTIIVLVLILGAVGSLVGINLHSRHKEKMEKAKPAGEK